MPVPCDRVGDHQRHGEEHGDHARGAARERLAPQDSEFLLLGVVAGLLLREGRLLGPWQLGLVAGLADRLDERLRLDARRIVGHGRALHHQIHRGVEHPGLALERLLHGRLAGGAGHALHREGDPGAGRRFHHGRSHGSSRHPFAGLDGTGGVARLVEGQADALEGCARRVVQDLRRADLDAAGVYALQLGEGFLNAGDTVPAGSYRRFGESGSAWEVLLTPCNQYTPLPYFGSSPGEE